MSGRPLPRLIEPLELARNARSLTGSISLVGLGRLGESLFSREGAVAISLHFGIDESGYACINGRLSANLKLVCQRCLESMDWPVETEFSLGIVTNERQMEALPANYEPLLVGAEPVLLADIIEDELILALPDIPAHEPSQCHQPDAGQESADSAHGRVMTPEGSNPFSVLERLKGKI